MCNRYNTLDQQPDDILERKMATNWKSRQKDRLADRDEQLTEIDKTGLPL